MSKLADLLNPAPSSAQSSSHRPPPINSSSPHRRNASITSPLEALALAATTAPPLQTSAAVAAAPSTLPPNPYAISAPFSPPTAHTTYSQPPPSNPYATTSNKPEMPLVDQGQMETSRIPSPVRTASNFAPHQYPADTIQPSVKIEQSEDPATGSVDASTARIKSEPAAKVDQSAAAGTTPALAAETTVTATAGQTSNSETREAGTATEIKPSVESGNGSTPVPKKTAPKKSVAKKGHNAAEPGNKRSAPRKRKLEPELSKDGTPFSQRSDTPASRISKTPARKNTPQQSSPPPSQDNASVADEDAEGGEYVDENEVFCVCRKPDDHTWMIGCDGGCDDWFHGRCVGMKERDGELIDKFVCPNCEAIGRGHTMWKPVCRLDGCRLPARVSGKKPSKYCSDEHGRQFMRNKAFKEITHGKDNASRKRRKQETAQNGANEEPRLEDESSDDGHQAHLRGGVVRPGELKALVNGSKSFEHFRKLGERIATPETTEISTNITDQDGDVKMAGGDTQEDAAPKLQFSAEDQAKLDGISNKRQQLESQIKMLGDKERFLNMVKTRHKAVLEDIKKRESVKDICGYDARLTWSEPEFDDWRHSDEGKQALESKTLSAPPRSEEQNGSTNGDEDDLSRGVCKKKRCERHKQWAKTEQNEINLARSQCWHNMRKLEGEEAGVKERAMLRQLEVS